MQKYIISISCPMIREVGLHPHLTNGLSVHPWDESEHAVGEVSLPTDEITAGIK
jgi:hypothetical protein